MQDGIYERVGDPQTLRADVRIIAATDQDLIKLIEQKSFRKDLFYRINVYPIPIASLHERLSDIPLLVEHFVKHFNIKFNKNINKISDKVIRQLQSYSWPGNVGELENVIERAVITSPPTRLVVEQLQKSEIDNENLVPLSEYERRYIIKVLSKTNWRINGAQGAAQILDLHPETLRSRIRKLGIERPVK